MTAQAVLTIHYGEGLMFLPGRQRPGALEGSVRPGPVTGFSVPIFSEAAAQLRISVMRY